MKPSPEQLAWRILGVKRKAFHVTYKAWQAGEPGFDQELLTAVRAEYVEARDAWEKLVTVGQRSAA